MGHIEFKSLTLRWLMTGESIEKDQRPILDYRVLKDAIKVVEWALSQIEETPESRKKTELIAAAYDFYLDEGVPK